MLALVTTLYFGEEAQPGKQRDTSIGKSDIGGLAVQHVHLGCSVSGDDGKQGHFPGQVLERAGHSGLKWGLGEGHQNQLQTPHGCDHMGDALGVFQAFNPTLKHRVQAKRTAMDHCMPA